MEAMCGQILILRLFAFLVCGKGLAPAGTLVHFVTISVASNSELGCRCAPACFKMWSASGHSYPTENVSSSTWRSFELAIYSQSDEKLEKQFGNV